MVWAFISFQLLFALANEWDWQLYETGVYYFKFSIKVFWVINSNGSWRRSCRDLLDSVYYEIDSMVCWSPCIYICVVTNNSSWRRSLPANPHNEVVVTVIKHFLIVGRTSSENLFTDQVVFYYTMGLCRLLSGICDITGRRRKGKGFKVPFK